MREILLKVLILPREKVYVGSLYYSSHDVSLETPLSIKDTKHARNILAYSRTDLPLAGYSEGKAMHGFAFQMQYKSYVCAQDDR